jgi:methylase of polypeptide subunit release factors
LRRALDVVSKEHVLQVNTHELPWLPGVAERLDGQGVPMQRRDAEKSLSRDWGGIWSTTDAEVHPPATDSVALVDYLLEIGVFRQRPDGRIDVPDLFLAGLGMNRKGGVRKR